MDAIEEYFQGEYIVEKNKIKEIDDLVIEVIKVLEKYDLEKGYPYVISKEPLDPKRNYSFCICKIPKFY